jgi:DNA polymerase-3 subunit epsilon
MVRETRDIDFELSGSELVALLMEDAAIKHHFPIFNQVSKRTIQSHALFSYEDRDGILHLAINKGRLVSNPLITFFTVRDTRLYLENICSKYNLCPKYCHLQESVPHCSHFNITDCKGVCKNEESVFNYNQRVHEAINAISINKQDVLLKETGRTTNEDAFVMIKDGIYLGYGFVNKEDSLNNHDDLTNYLIPQKDNKDIQKILKTRIYNLA